LAYCVYHEIVHTRLNPFAIHNLAVYWLIAKMLINCKNDTIYNTFFHPWTKDSVHGKPLKPNSPPCNKIAIIVKNMLYFALSHLTRVYYGVKYTAIIITLLDIVPCTYLYINVPLTLTTQSLCLQYFLFNFYAFPCFWYMFVTF